MSGIRHNITFEFHTSFNARKKYELEDNLFTLTGDLIVADFNQARKLAYKINQVRKTENEQHNLTTPGQVNALGLIHEIFHFLIGGDVTHRFHQFVQRRRTWKRPAAD